MIMFGLDPSTTTGWALLENDILIERGTIQLLSQMGLPQKLNYFRLELKSLLERLKPDWVFIEDVILCLSGVSVLSYLSRLNGVAISTSFEFLQDRVKLYTPNYWKANSFPGLKGSAKKWEIQLAVIKHYNIPVTGNFELIDKTIKEKSLEISEINKKIDECKILILERKKSLLRKKNPITLQEKDICEKELKVFSTQLSKYKHVIKDKEHSYDKVFRKISIDLASQTGITENVADACGIALCGWKELNDSNKK